MSKIVPSLYDSQNWFIFANFPAIVVSATRGASNAPILSPCSQQDRVDVHTVIAGGCDVKIFHLQENERSEIVKYILESIKQVQILLDGIETVNGNYESQPTVDFFNYIFPLNATPKAVIDVVGKCNLGGTIKGSVTV
jgi:hypothetical protein